MGKKYPILGTEINYYPGRKPDYEKIAELSEAIFFLKERDMGSDYGESTPDSKHWYNYPKARSTPDRELWYLYSEACALFYDSFLFPHYLTPSLDSSPIYDKTRYEYIEAINKIAPGAYRYGKKPSRIFRGICEAIGVTNERGFDRMYAQISDELCAKEMHRIHPLKY